MTKARDECSRASILRARGLDAQLVGKQKSPALAGPDSGHDRPKTFHSLTEIDLEGRRDRETKKPHSGGFRIWAQVYRASDTLSQVWPQNVKSGHISPRVGAEKGAAG